MSRLSAKGGSVYPGPTRVWTDFRYHPIHMGKVLADGTTFAFGPPTIATGDQNIMIIPGYGTVGSVGFEWFIMGTQTIATGGVPVIANGGLDISCDQTNNDGLQIDLGLTTQNPCRFTVGTDACYVEMEVTPADASGCDPLIVGFRKEAARTADYNDYTDFAALGIEENGGTTNPAPICTVTALNNAATVRTVTGSTWADAATKKLGVYVSKDGVVSYLVSDVAPTGTVAYTFDTGDVIVPFIYFLHGSDVAGSVVLSLFDCGLA